MLAFGQYTSRRWTTVATWVKRVATLVVVTALALGLVVVVPLSDAHADEWNWSSHGDKYNRVRVRWQWDPLQSGWQWRRIHGARVGGSRGGSPDINHWYRTEYRLGTEWSDGRYDNNYASTANGPNHFNYNCFGDWQECEWDLMGADSDWQSRNHSSRLRVRAWNRIVCDDVPTCGDFTVFRNIAFDTPNW